MEKGKFPHGDADDYRPVFDTYQYPPPNVNVAPFPPGYVTVQESQHVHSPPGQNSYTYTKTTVEETHPPGKKDKLNKPVRACALLLGWTLPPSAAVRTSLEIISDFQKACNLLHSGTVNSHLSELWRGISSEGPRGMLKCCYCPDLLESVLIALPENSLDSDDFVHYFGLRFVLLRVIVNVMVIRLEHCMFEDLGEV